MQDDIKKKVQILGGALLALGIFSFGIYRSHDILFGSSLSVETISPSTHTEITQIKGVAPRAREVMINGRNTPVNIDGSFTSPIALLPGYNILTVNSTNPFGKTQKKTVSIFYTPTETLGVNIPPVEKDTQKQEETNLHSNIN